MQNHMSLNHFNADELPLQLYEMENTKVIMKKETHSQNNIKERKH